MLSTPLPYSLVTRTKHVPGTWYGYVVRGTEVDNMHNCTELFDRVFDLWEKHYYPFSNYEVYWLGFMAGQAEKVYLETVPAAVFTDNEITRKVAKIIADVYKLDSRVIGDEIWLSKYWCIDDILNVVLQDNLSLEQRNYVRGQLCGIPARAIHLEFPQ